MNKNNAEFVFSPSTKLLSLKNCESFSLNFFLTLLFPCMQFYNVFLHLPVGKALEQVALCKLWSPDTSSADGERPWALRSAPWGQSHSSAGVWVGMQNCSFQPRPTDLASIFLTRFPGVLHTH